MKKKGKMYRGVTRNGETVTSFPATLMQFCIPQAHKKKKRGKFARCVRREKNRIDAFTATLQRFHALQR